jgi:hypothetical protein
MDVVNWASAEQSKAGQSSAGANNPLLHPDPCASASDVRLEDASCWTLAHARLLWEALIADADWAEVVDRLNLVLRTG